MAMEPAINLSGAKIIEKMVHDDPCDELVHLEAEIDELAGVIDRARKLDLIAKSVIAGGAIYLLGCAVGLIAFDPIALVGALAAVIGGIVVFGSNTSTLKQASAHVKAAEARRAELIGRAAEDHPAR